MYCTYIRIVHIIPFNNSWSHEEIYHYSPWIECGRCTQLNHFISVCVSLWTFRCPARSISFSFIWDQALDLHSLQSEHDHFKSLCNSTVFSMNIYSYGMLSGKKWVKVIWRNDTIVSSRHNYLSTEQFAHPTPSFLFVCRCSIADRNSLGNESLATNSLIN